MFLSLGAYSRSTTKEGHAGCEQQHWRVASNSAQDPSAPFWCWRIGFVTTLFISGRGPELTHSFQNGEADERQQHQRQAAHFSAS
eukprot:COSAG05_NODE_12634_length_460_cov_1.196676_2_plen_84_part_01